MALSGRQDLRRHVFQVAARLEAHYGPVQWRGGTEPLETLVETILSQNTNDRNRDMAFGALKAAYPSWDAVAQAPVGELAGVIRCAGLNHQKAVRIQNVLRTLYKEHGRFSLDHLRVLSLSDAFQALTRFPGVGKKTAGIVLTFALDKPYFPVDTHIKRITARLRWVKPGQDPHDAMNALVPPKAIRNFHLHLIWHGRDTCKARKPQCAGCVINDLCPIFPAGLK